MNEYQAKINALIQKVPTSLLDLDLPRVKARTPTQASSNFITNKEQGDWAENLVLQAINSRSKNYVAVKYGKSDDLVAGEDGFELFYEQFQEELDIIGKRPDLLVFKRDDYVEDWRFDISKLSFEKLHNITPRAVAGLEIRSSAFLIEKYDATMQYRTQFYTETALKVKNEILNEFTTLLDHPKRKKYLEILQSINAATLSVCDFRAPSWQSTEDLLQLTERFKVLKNAIKEIQKRDFLSITPKVEDLKVVYQWIQTYGVPHYYFQVFFDKVFGISYENILKIISNPENEEIKFFVEGDVKNQDKTAIKINAREGIEIAGKIDMPTHKSKMKEMDRGRLLFYVSFEGGFAYLNLQKLNAVLQLNENIK